MAQKRKKLKCRLCGHVWEPKLANPKRCANPKCRSERWNIGRARDRRADQLARAEQARRLDVAEKNAQLPILGTVRGQFGYQVLPVTVRWVKPPPGLKFKAGDYCLLLESLPDEPDIINEAVGGHNVALFRPGVGYLGLLAHIETGAGGGDKVYFAKVRLEADGREVILEPHLLRLPPEQLEVRGTFQGSFRAELQDIDADGENQHEDSEP